MQDVDYDALRARLLADGQVLDLPDSTAHRPNGAIRAADLPGVVVDDAAAEFAGEWAESARSGPFVGVGYRHDGNAAKGERSARFRAELPPGRYEVRLAYSPSSNRATNVPIVSTTPTANRA